MSIEVKNIVKRFGSFTALNDVSLQFASGELTALLKGLGATVALPWLESAAALAAAPPAKKSPQRFACL